MKSRISFFSAGVSKNLLRRCWPLWAAWLVLVLLLLPGELLNRIEHMDLTARNANSFFLNNGISVVALSVFAVVIAVMAVFSYLYTAKGSGMMCSLPLRRETVFVTAYLTGLIPMLLADILAVGLSWLVCLGSGAVRNLVFAQTLGLILTANIAFYNFAVFCAMLTGSLIVLPAVYLVLNAAVSVAEAVICTALSFIVYGMNGNGGNLTFLSPMLMVFHHLGLYSENTWEYRIQGMGYLLLFLAVSFLLVGLAVWLLRRRHMESATDVVAVPILKPVFQYCMAGGCAFVFGVMLYEAFFVNSLAGFPAALVLLALLIIGAFLGYFAAEMLLQKTVRVFGKRKKYRGWGICCAVLTLLILCFELDVFGYERYVPQTEKIDYVRLDYDNSHVKTPENVEKVLDYHRQILGNKSFNEHSEQYRTTTLEYYLTNGRVIHRRYPLAWDWETINDESSDACTYQRLVNLQEAIDNRCRIEVPVSADTVTSFTVHSYRVDERGTYEDEVLKFTAEEAEDFYYNYLLPDIQEGKMGRRWPVENETYYQTVSNVRFEMEFSNRSLLPTPINNKDVRHEYYTFTLAMDAQRCLDWLKEHSEVEALPLCEADSSYRDYSPVNGEIVMAHNPEEPVAFVFN